MRLRMAAMTIFGEDRRGSAAGTLGSGPNEFGRADAFARGLWPGDAFEQYGAVGRHYGGWVADLGQDGNGEGAGRLTIRCGGAVNHSREANLHVIRKRSSAPVWRRVDDLKTWRTGVLHSLKNLFEMRV